VPYVHEHAPCHCLGRFGQEHVWSTCFHTPFISDKRLGPRHRYYLCSSRSVSPFRHPSWSFHSRVAVRFRGLLASFSVSVSPISPRHFDLLHGCRGVESICRQPPIHGPPPLLPTDVIFLTFPPMFPPQISGLKFPSSASLSLLVSRPPSWAQSLLPRLLAPRFASPHHRRSARLYYCVLIPFGAHTLSLA
jgi:hypothetical protein